MLPGEALMSIKALHPTAYSYARRASSLRFRRRVSLVLGE